MASGSSTPLHDTRHFGIPVSSTPRTEKKAESVVKKAVILEYDSDIDPDDLLPVYLDCKRKLFESQTSRLNASRQRENGRRAVPRTQPQIHEDPEAAKMIRKIKRIEDDVLFDQYLAGHQWETIRIGLERNAAANRLTEELKSDDLEVNSDDSEDEVSKEAARIGAAMLEDDDSDDDQAISDLFASLPVSEVDPLTGKSSTVINDSSGVKVFVRDFGKLSGVSPRRLLEETCKAR